MTKGAGRIQTRACSPLPALFSKKERGAGLGKKRAPLRRKTEAALCGGRAELALAADHPDGALAQRRDQLGEKHAGAIVQFRDYFVITGPEVGIVLPHDLAPGIDHAQLNLASFGQHKTDGRLLDKGVGSVLEEPQLSLIGALLGRLLGVGEVELYFSLREIGLESEGWEGFVVYPQQLAELTTALQHPELEGEYGCIHG